MANHGRKFARALALAALCLLLGGCATNVSTDKLYALPSLPAEYASLEAEINALLSDGAEHAAPISGSNLQSVQMVDLDGDGVEEAVAFFRKATDERPVKIYFFRSNGDSYEQMALIEGTASSIYSITYYDLDGDGRREILVGFKSGTELQVLAVYTLRGSEPLNLLTTAYLRYAVSDLDGDGRQELTVLYSGEENRCMADCYTWDDRELSCISTLELSFSASELSRVAAGALSDGQQALYVTGVADNSVAAYDILTVKNGVLRNVTQNTASSAVDGGFRFLSLYPTDIDGSGVIESRSPSRRSMRRARPTTASSGAITTARERVRSCAAPSTTPPTAGACSCRRRGTSGCRSCVPERPMKTRSFSSAAAATDSCSRFWRSAPSRAAPARSTPGAVTALCSPDRSRPFTPPSSCPATTGTARSTRRP